MWQKISSLIIKYRLSLLVLTVLITAFMAYKGKDVELTYDFAKVVPVSDPEMQYFTQFQQTFGEDGNVLAIGFKDTSVFQLQKFAELKRLTDSILVLEGISQVIGPANLPTFVKNPEKKSFEAKNLFTEFPTNQSVLDSLRIKFYEQRFFEGRLYNEKSGALLIAVYYRPEYLNSFRRQTITRKILDHCTTFTEATGIELHFAGLPYIRTTMVGKVQKEFYNFLYLSALATCVVLYFFFRSFRAVLFAGLVIGISIVWTMGTIVLFGYKMTLLTGMLPALIVVISIPNCVYMLNKYHLEYKIHRNKMIAINSIISKIGFIAFFTNANTAVGFLVLMITDISIIREFGVVAGIMSILTFLVSVMVIPPLLIYMPAPKDRHLKHLDKKTINVINAWLEHMVFRYRRPAFIITGLVIAASVYGVFQIKAIAYMVDDLPKRSTILSDLAFFEKEFTGVMPLEVVIDFGDQKNALTKPSNLRLIEKFDTYIREEEPNITSPISVLNVVKAGTQAFYGGNPDRYRLPTNMEKNFILPYFKNMDGTRGLTRSMVDSTGTKVRMSMNVADMGNKKIDSLTVRIRQQLSTIFDGTGIETHVTGTTPLFLKGIYYLINDLTKSLIIAFVVISLMMAFIFANLRMIIISVIPNVIPLLMTAGVMGYFDIPLKTSTALIFSISFGISIDNTVHYLSKYKQELAFWHGNVRKAAIRSLRESSVSMIYTSLVLFFGFGIFTFSDFGGTVALGLLTSLTLFFSLFCNLILLPMLILAFTVQQEKRIKRRAEKKARLAAYLNNQ